MHIVTRNGFCTTEQKSVKLTRLTRTSLRVLICMSLYNSLRNSFKAPKSHYFKFYPSFAPHSQRHINLFQCKRKKKRRTNESEAWKKCFTFYIICLRLGKYVSHHDKHMAQLYQHRQNRGTTKKNEKKV